MKIQTILLTVLLVWNSMVVVLYARDKQLARRKQYRISERTLLWTTLFGGGLGALAAGNIYHHKTRKWYFQCAWWLGTLIDLAIIYVIWRM